VLKNALKAAIQELMPDIISWRHYFHRFPESSHQEKMTGEKISGLLKDLGFEVRNSIAGYGVTADLTGRLPGPTIGLRADMDAIPVKEETGLSYASENDGLMHACGHDGHMASLLGAAAVLTRFREHLTGKIRVIFQPAEEKAPSGAEKMVELGIINDVDTVFSFHFWPDLSSGVFATLGGPVTAASDYFNIKIIGRGGHGAAPHQTVDALLVASHFVMSCQHLISRKINPLETGVLSFGKLQAGTQFNVIAEEAVLEGTVRSFKPEIQNIIEQGLINTADSLAKMYGAKINVHYQKKCPSVVNDAREAKIAARLAEEVFGWENTIEHQPSMAADDFSYFLQKTPGAYCFIGIGEEGDNYPLHHSKFYVSDKDLQPAVEWLCMLALYYTAIRERGE